MIRILLSRKLGELRWTQADLARAAKIRPTTINELYHELVDRIELGQIDRICEGLDCDLSEIMIREKNPEGYPPLPPGALKTPGKQNK